MQRVKRVDDIELINLGDRLIINGEEVDRGEVELHLIDHMDGSFSIRFYSPCKRYIIGSAIIEWIFPKSLAESKMESLERISELKSMLIVTNKYDYISL